MRRESAAAAAAAAAAAIFHHHHAGRCASLIRRVVQGQQGYGAGGIHHCYFFILRHAISLLNPTQVDIMWSRLCQLERRLARGEYDPQHTRILKPAVAAPCTGCAALRVQLEQAAATAAADAADAAAAAASTAPAPDSSSSSQSTMQLQQQLAETNAALSRACKDNDRFQKVRSKHTQ